MRSGPVRQLLTKVGLLPLRDLARPEEPRVVRGSSRRRIPALFVLIVVLIVIASLAGQPLATDPAQAKLFPPGKEPYQIPLRWCALMGTTAAKVGGDAGGGPLHERHPPATSDAGQPNLGARREHRLSQPVS